MTQVKKQITKKSKLKQGKLASNAIKEAKAENLPSWVLLLIVGIIVLAIIAYVVFRIVIGNRFQGNWVQF